MRVETEEKDPEIVRINQPNEQAQTNENEQN